jgi:hypothetical protein
LFSSWVTLTEHYWVTFRERRRHLFKMIEYGGPLLYHGGEDQQRSFDSTCRKFRRFLTEKTG